MNSFWGIPVVDYSSKTRERFRFRRETYARELGGVMAIGMHNSDTPPALANPLFETV